MNWNAGLVHVILREIRRHLKRRVDHDVERELLGERRSRVRLLGTARTPGAALDQQVEDARREIHRPREQAREVEIRLVLGRIAALPSPRVVFLSARAFPAHHVRISATLARVVDRLVDVHHDVILCRGLDHLAIVPHHELRVVRVPFGRGVGDVARLDRVETERVIERERGVQLPLVVDDSARRLVVHDQLDALRLRVLREPRAGRSPDRPA